MTPKILKELYHYVDRGFMLYIKMTGGATRFVPVLLLTFFNLTSGMTYVSKLTDS